MTVWEIMFSFEGRIRRTQFWLGRLGLAAAVMVLFILVGGIAGLVGATSHSEAGVGAVFLGVAVIAVPMLFWAGLALLVKRWHDRDKSGLWVFIGLIPLIGGIWELVECGFLDGTPGPNQYGPSPKGLGVVGTASVFS